MKNHKAVLAARRRVFALLTIGPFFAFTPATQAVDAPPAAQTPTSNPIVRELKNLDVGFDYTESTVGDSKTKGGSPSIGIQYYAKDFSLLAFDVEAKGYYRYQSNTVGANSQKDSVWGADLGKVSFSHIWKPLDAAKPYLSVGYERTSRQQMTAGVASAVVRNSITYGFGLGVKMNDRLDLNIGYKRSLQGRIQVSQNVSVGVVVHFFVKEKPAAAKCP